MDSTHPDTQGEPTDRYEALQEFVEAHCPVLDLTVNQTPVVSELRITD